MKSRQILYEKIDNTYCHPCISRIFSGSTDCRSDTSTAALSSFLDSGNWRQPRDGQKPQYLKTLTAKITLGEDFDVRVDDGNEYISGRAEARNGKIHLRMKSHFYNDTYGDDEFVELEKKYLAGHDGIGMSGIIFISYFVLSTNADCKPFLLTKPEQPDTVLKTNLSSSVSVNRPLSDVRSAIQAYCADRTSHPGFYTSRTNDVPGVSYGIDLMDCAFDVSGPLNGEIVATSLTDGDTRLELRTVNALPKDSVVATRLEKHLSSMLDQIVKIVERKP